MGYYSNTYKLYIKFLVFLKPYWGKGVIAGLFMLIVAVMQLPSPLLTKYLIDHIVPAKDLVKLNLFIFILIAVILVNNLITYFQRKLLITYRNKVEQDIRYLLFKTVIEAKLDLLEKVKVGYLESRIDKDVDQVDRLLMETILEILMNGITFVVGTILLFYLNTRLAVVSIISLPIFIITFHIFSKKMNLLSKMRQEKWAIHKGNTIEYIRQAKTIKAFGRLKDFFHLFFLSLERAVDTSRRLELYSVLSGIIIGLAGALLPLFVLWYGVREIILDKFTLGGFIAFNSCIGYLYNPVRSFINLNIDIHAASAAADRIFEILDYHAESLFFGDIQVKKIHSIELKKIGFNYQGKNLGIEDISFSLSSGKNLVIVGETGRGKSTIFRVIMGFNTPSCGVLLLNGTDYTQFSLQSIRDRIGYVPQEPDLFSGTIRANITFFSKLVDESLVDWVVEICELTSTLCRFDKGLDTDIFEAGAGLSGGEKQRIAIARALYRKPDLIIFDEATSAIDQGTEEKLISKLVNLPWKPAILFATHRLSILHHFETVLSIDES